MVSKLEIDPYFLMSKRDDGGIIDRRKLRSQMSPYDKTLMIITETLDKFGVSDNLTLANNLMEIKTIYQLNKPLLCLVYLYLQKKDFQLSNVVANFDEDFEKQLNILSSAGFFNKNLNSEEKIYRFRQDFIIYLFLVQEFYTAKMEDSSEEYYYEDSSGDSSEIIDIEIDEDIEPGL